MSSDSAQNAPARLSGNQAKYETVGTTNFQKGLRFSGSDPPFCAGSLLFIKIHIAFMNCPCCSNSIRAACPILSPNCTFFRWCSRAVADRNSLVSRSSTCSGSVKRRTSLCCQCFFLIAGCIGSLGYWQSLAKRESKKQHQWYCIPKESQVPIHYDLRHHNLCMTERMVH